MKKDKKSKSVKPKYLILPVLVLLVGITGYFIFYNYIYSSLELTTNKDLVIEYGSGSYNLNKFIKKSNGEVTSIEDNIDTSVVGEQQVNVTLKKFNISKVVSFYVDIVDKVAPVISISSDEITITEGDSYSIFDNINSVIDDVDGELSFLDRNDINEESNCYYTIDTNFDNSNSGTYDVNITAIDKAYNISTKSFKVIVKEPVITFRQVTYASNAGVNSNSGGIVGTAYSLIGSPYAGGGNSPSGFDCSGFVQYVYAQNGLNISRSATTQIYDGVGVNYSDAAPGDILVWGYSNGHVTHSALYVGNDQMIHAANYSTGVILSSVSGWTRGSNVQVLYVRRVVS